MSFQSVPLPIAQLSLSAVLNSGQSFRWSLFQSHEYRLCLRDRVVCLRQSDTTLFYRALFPFPPQNAALRDAETLLWLNDYFQLHIDLTALYREWSARDPVFAAFQSRFQGIRILRQDPWENLVSYVHFISSVPIFISSVSYVHPITTYYVSQRWSRPSATITPPRFFPSQISLKPIAITHFRPRPLLLLLVSLRPFVPWVLDIVQTLFTAQPKCL